MEIEAYTIQSFAEAFGLGKTKIYAEIKLGRLPIKKVGKRTLIPAAGAKRWFADLPGIRNE
jgi:excisionase family DNA binding protein